ncbi:MAG: aldo/keto reductase [Pseudomonadota bacterium]
MERRRLGRTDIDVSVLCLGTMMYGDQINEADAFHQMDVCLERGVDFFDTAEMYTVPPKPETQGNSERIVGKWMSDRGVRDKIVLATKVAGRAPFTWLREDGGETRLSTEQIKFAVEGSLERLGTDYIDLYQTHWPDRGVQNFGGILHGYRHYEDNFIALEETLRAMEDLVKEGKVRYFGVSNETPWGVMEMLRLSDAQQLPRVQSIQNAYSFINRTFEMGLAEVAMQEHVGLLAYSPIAQGVLTGKYLDGAKPEGARGTLYGRLGRYETTAAEGAIRDYVALAAKYDVDPAAFALQFVNTRPFVTSNIFGARGDTQLETALSSVDLNWTAEMENAVHAIHAGNQNPCP